MIVGVDTHRQIHVAVAVSHLGARLGDIIVAADRDGYAELVSWANALGETTAFGIKGTGSYGVGLASFVRRQGVRVVEVKPLRSSDSAQQRQERHHRRRNRCAVGVGWGRDRDPKVG